MNIAGIPVIVDEHLPRPKRTPEIAMLERLIAACKLPTGELTRANGYRAAVSALGGGHSAFFVKFGQSSVVKFGPSNYLVVDPVTFLHHLKGFTA